MPDPDLLIRTSGEMRISNFLLWQIAYTEIFVTERSGPTSAASICSKPSPTSSAASAATAASAKTAAKWKKIPTASRSPRAEGRLPPDTIPLFHRVSQLAGGTVPRRRAIYSAVNQPGKAA